MLGTGKNLLPTLIEAKLPRLAFRMRTASRGFTAFLGLLYTKVLEQDFLCFGVPQAVVGIAAVGQFGEQRVGFAFFTEICDGGEGQVELCIGQLLPAGDFGKVGGGFRDGVDAADVGDHYGRADFSLGGQANGFL